MTPQQQARHDTEAALYRMGHEVRDTLNALAKVVGRDSAVALASETWDTGDVQLADVDRAVDHAIQLAVRYAAKTFVMENL